MVERFDREVDVESRPIEVMGRRQLDVRKLSDGGVLEPRNSLKDTNRSRSSIRTQKPCDETLVTSTAEVLRPRREDLVVVLLDDFECFRNSSRSEAIIGSPMRLPAAARILLRR